MHKENSPGRSICGHMRVQPLNYVPFSIYEQAQEEGGGWRAVGWGAIRGLPSGKAMLTLWCRSTIAANEIDLGSIAQPEPSLLEAKHQKYIYTKVFSFGIYKPSNWSGLPLCAAHERLRMSTCSALCVPQPPPLLVSGVLEC